MSRRRARGEAHGAGYGTAQGTPGGALPTTPGAPSAATPATIDGSLCDHPARTLLDLCQRQRVTGVLQIVSWGRVSRVELRAGRIAAATYGTLAGNGAVSEILALRDGVFELRQELPRPAERDAGGAELSAVMQQCREGALSCRIEVTSRGQRAVVTVRAGELERVEIDGAPPRDAGSGDLAAALAPFEHGAIRVEPVMVSLQAPVAVPVAAPAPRSDTPSAPRAVPAEGSQRTAKPPPRPPIAPERRAPPFQPVPPPPPRATARPHADAALTPGLQPWLPGPSVSGAAASWREAPAHRRDLALPAVLAVLALSLLLIIGLVALQP